MKSVKQLKLGALYSLDVGECDVAWFSHNEDDQYFGQSLDLPEKSILLYVGTEHPNITEWVFLHVGLNLKITCANTNFRFYLKEIAT